MKYDTKGEVIKITTKRSHGNVVFFSTVFEVFSEQRSTAFEGFGRDYIIYIIISDRFLNIGAIVVSG